MAAKVKNTRLRPGTKVEGSAPSGAAISVSRVSAEGRTALSAARSQTWSRPNRRSHSGFSAAIRSRTCSRQAISTTWRWPYSKPTVSTWSKRSSAQARQVAESWPPEKRTRARWWLVVMARALSCNLSVGGEDSRNFARRHASPSRTCEQYSHLQHKSKTSAVQQLIQDLQLGRVLSHTSALRLKGPLPINKIAPGSSRRV